MMVGGLGRALISVISFAEMLLRACCAASRAGIASSRALDASFSSIAI
jgi:hypothetical protein